MRNGGDYIRRKHIFKPNLFNCIQRDRDKNREKDFERGRERERLCERERTADEAEPRSLSEEQTT